MGRRVSLAIPRHRGRTGLKTGLDLLYPLLVAMWCGGTTRRRRNSTVAIECCRLTTSSNQVWALHTDERARRQQRVKAADGATGRVPVTLSCVSAKCGRRHRHQRRHHQEGGGGDGDFSSWLGPSEATGITLVLALAGILTRGAAWPPRHGRPCRCGGWRGRRTRPRRRSNQTRCRSRSGSRRSRAGRGRPCG